MYQIPCKNCKGKGIISHFAHVENGICFKCYGSKVEEVTEAEYNDYIASLKRRKQGEYILFNNGSIEYYKTEKEIEKRYGNFYTGSYAWAVHQSYKDDNIVFTRHTEESNEFIKAVKTEFRNRREPDIKKKIKKCKELLKEDTDDKEWIEMVNEKINELEKELSNL